jgi:serine/threonine-protein kinase
MARDLLPLIRKALDARYTVEREVGRGGAARVFQARNAAGQEVALKVLHPQLAASVSADRFLREIKLVSQLEHPRIARLLDYGEDEWLLWYVMEYVPGPTLRQHLDRAKHTSLSDGLHIAHDLLSALQAAHLRGIVHRDVKPENILLCPEGAVLVDFGIAKAVAVSGADRLTRSGFAVGTSSYMSPEQIAGVENVDTRSDLYSLGCVLFESLAGRPPYDDPFEDVVLTKHQTAPVPDVRERRPEVPAAFAEAIKRAMAKHPRDRWPTAEAMEAALPAMLPT